MTWWMNRSWIAARAGSMFEPVDRRQYVGDDVDGPARPPERGGDLRGNVGVAGDDDELRARRGSDGGGVLEHLAPLAAVGAAAEQQDLGAHRAIRRAVGFVEVAGDDELDLGPGVERSLAPGCRGELVDQPDRGHPQATAGAGGRELGDDVAVARRPRASAAVERRAVTVHHVGVDGRRRRRPGRAAGPSPPRRG